MRVRSTKTFFLWVVALAVFSGVGIAQATNPLPSGSDANARQFVLASAEKAMTPGSPESVPAAGAASTQSSPTADRSHVGLAQAVNQTRHLVQHGVLVVREFRHQVNRCDALDIGEQVRLRIRELEVEVPVE